MFYLDIGIQYTSSKHNSADSAKTIYAYFYNHYTFIISFYLCALDYGKMFNFDKKTES